MRKESLFPSWIWTALVAAAIYLLVWYGKAAGLINDYWYGVIEQMGFVAVLALGLNLVYGFNGQFSLGQIGLYGIGAYASALITKDFVTPWSGHRVGGLSWIIAGQLGVLAALLVMQQLRIGSGRKRLSRWMSSYLKPYESWLLVTLVSVALVAVGIAVGVVVTWGLAQVLMPVLGGVLTSLPSGLANGLVLFLALVNGGTMAALAAYLVGMPLLRLGSDYFGIATLGFSIMVYTALQSSDLVIATMKGARGMVGIPVWTTWGWVFGALVVVVIIMRHLIHSSYGRAIVAVREDEIAAKTMGIDVAQTKTIAFAVGGLFAGIAGGLYAHLFGLLHPSVFNFVKGFDPMIVIVFGGLGSMTGTILGSALFMLITEGLRVVLPQDMIDWRFVIYPIFLLLIMLLRKQGLMGTTEWGWLRAPLPPERDIPTPDRTTVSASKGEDA